MYAVGVGRAADMAELREIASQPEYVYTSPSFKDLQSITSKIRRRFCDGKCFTLVSIQYSVKITLGMRRRLCVGSLKICST